MKLIKSPTLLHLVKSNTDRTDSKCISIFLPTHRAHPESAQDAIRFKNLANEALRLASDQESSFDLDKLKTQLHEVETDPLFWKSRTDGLGVFYTTDNPDDILVLELPRSVPERVVVADSFHVKPLIRILQSAENYYVLALTRDSAKVFFGNRDSLNEVKIDEFPSSAEETLPGEKKEQELRAESYGGIGNAMFHGHGSKSDEVNRDRDKYFRIVSDYVEKNLINPSKLPLILVALDEHHAPFRSIFKSSSLLESGVHKDPHSMNSHELKDAVWEVLRPYLKEEFKSELERFGTAKANQKGSSILSDVLREANNGRIELLFLEEERLLNGKIDWVTGNVEESHQASQDSHQQGDNAYDDLAEKVLANGGAVKVVPMNALGTPSGIAAIYRY